MVPGPSKCNKSNGDQNAVISKRDLSLTSLTPPRFFEMKPKSIVAAESTLKQAHHKTIPILILLVNFLYLPKVMSTIYNMRLNKTRNHSSQSCQIPKTQRENLNEFPSFYVDQATNNFNSQIPKAQREMLRESPSLYDEDQATNN